MALQFIMALTVVGLYGAEIDNAVLGYPSPGVNPRWVFAVVIAVFSIVASFVGILCVCMRASWANNFALDATLW